METMLKFKRLSSISDDSKVITEALKKSTAGLMEVKYEICYVYVDCALIVVILK